MNYEIGVVVLDWPSGLNMDEMALALAEDALSGNLPEPFSDDDDDA